MKLRQFLQGTKGFTERRQGNNKRVNGGVYNTVKAMCRHWYNIASKDQGIAKSYLIAFCGATKCTHKCHRIRVADNFYVEVLVGNQVLDVSMIKIVIHRRHLHV